MRLNDDEDCLTCGYCKSVFYPSKDDEGVSVLEVESGEECPVPVPLVRLVTAIPRPAPVSTSLTGPLISAATVSPPLLV